MGFVEVHEQGHGTQRIGLLGVVTSINGGVRYVGEVVGAAPVMLAPPHGSAATLRPSPSWSGGGKTGIRRW
jgi:hypothetical protein